MFLQRACVWLGSHPPVRSIVQRSLSTFPIRSIQWAGFEGALSVAAAGGEEVQGGRRQELHCNRDYSTISSLKIIWPDL